MTSPEKIKISEETIKKFNDLLKEKGIFNESLNLQEHLEKITVDEFGGVCSSQSMKKGVEYMAKEDKAPYTLIVNKSQTGKINGFIYIKPVNSCVKTGDFIGHPTCSIEFLCTSIRGISKYLIGLVMYAIYNDNKHIKNVILQTDGGHTNTSAYCLYKKMGFNYDKLLMPSCFKIGMNLPMFCNPYDDDTLIQYLKTSDNYDEICLEKDLDEQKKMAAYKKMETYLETYLFEISKGTKTSCETLKKMYRSNEEHLSEMYEKYIKTLISKHPDIVLESYKSEDVSKRCAMDLKLLKKEFEKPPVPAPLPVVPAPLPVVPDTLPVGSTPSIVVTPPSPRPDEIQPPETSSTMSAGLKKRKTRNRKKTNKRISKKTRKF